MAELGQTPFDLLDAESEIVAGFHVEYSGMKFALFFLAEFINAFFMSALFATMYLGGWRGPGAVAYPLLGLIYFMLKTFLVYLFLIWIRGTLPRVRIDQLLYFNWKFLVPLVLTLILVVAVVAKLIPTDANEWLRAGILFVVNILLAVTALEIARRYARGRRQAVGDDEESRGVTAPALSGAAD
jgi:NADH-quinone oxidoreductase subunit H